MAYATDIAVRHFRSSAGRRRAAASGRIGFLLDILIYFLLLLGWAAVVRAALARLQAETRRSLVAQDAVGVGLFVTPILLAPLCAAAAGSPRARRSAAHFDQRPAVRCICTIKSAPVSRPARWAGGRATPPRRPAGDARLSDRVHIFLYADWPSLSRHDPGRGAQHARWCASPCVILLGVKAMQNNQNRRLLWILLGAAALLLCCCCIVIGLSGSLLFWNFRADRTAPQ